MANNRLNELLSREEPEEIVNKDKEFKPKFNVREEFVLWVREQFPNLKYYDKKNKSYKELEERKDEIYQAALGAVNHGVLSTQACASGRLQSGWEKFEKEFRKVKSGNLAKGLEDFVRSLEELSTSLGGDKHFTQAGKFLDETTYNNSWYGDLNAFIYRVGGENEKNTTYLVFDKAQEFKEGQSAVLIGEFTQLTKWEYRLLKRTTSKFKGPEAEFIERVDRVIPEERAYSSSSYTTYYADDFDKNYLDYRYRTPTISSKEKGDSSKEDSIKTARLLTKIPILKKSLG